jgi:predicted nucleic acid-binding protein
MISTFTALFDSSVLFGIRLTSLLMELAMSGLFRPRWSNDIHREWMKAVSEQRGIPIEKLQSRREAMDGAVLDCCVSGYEDLIGALTLPDPNDRHVLAAAITCGADVIVTFDLKHFPTEVLDKYGIHIKHPDDSSWTRMGSVAALSSTQPGMIVTIIATRCYR